MRWSRRFILYCRLDNCARFIRNQLSRTATQEPVRILRTLPLNLYESLLAAPQSRVGALHARGATTHVADKTEACRIQKIFIVQLALSDRVTVIEQRDFNQVNFLTNLFLVDV